VLLSYVRRLARRLGLIAALPLVTGTVWLAAAGPTFACSCVESRPMAAYDTPQNAIFAGTAGPLDARGVPVRVTAWYHGAGAAPLVYLAKSSFGDGAACGTTPPPVGTSWIWVTWLPAGGGDAQTGLCSPSARLDTGEGAAMVAEATATFGGAPPPGAAGDLTEPSAVPTVPTGVAVPVLVATLALGLALFGGVALLARRRSRAP